MRRLAMPTAMAAAVIATAGAAQGASERDALIRPGVGIGKVRLGMSLTQVKRALGPRFLVNKRVRRGFGVSFVELGWDYSWWRVGFLVRRGRYRVVLVATQYRTERTRQGVGVGTPKGEVVRRFGARCPGPGRPGFGTCIVGPPGGRQTIFDIVARCVKMPPTSHPLGCAEANQRPEVFEVIVREPF